MKRGFLNTAKAKAKLAANADDHSVCEDKGMEKAETSAGPSEPRPYLPLLDLHSVPPSTKATMNYPRDRNRFVFRFWPRDPNGKTILPSDIHGKKAGNGLDLWGATLYDFYFVRRTPGDAHDPTIFSGSKLAKAMEAFGELDHARDELSWATREANPAEILAWDPAQATMIHERRVLVCSGVATVMNKTRYTGPGVPATGPETDGQMSQVTQQARNVEVAKDSILKDGANGQGADSPNAMGEGGMQRLGSAIPVESPFHPSHYPSPWPLTPFESLCNPFALQRGIPIHLLPKKLHVHDPWRLVETNLDGRKEPRISKTQRIRTYSLELPSESRKIAEEASKAAAAAEDEALRTPETIFIRPQETEGPTEQPAVCAYLPKRPRRPTDVPEAHLYLSPKGRLGTGNHSIVYEAELELPRDLFCKSTCCKLCLDEQIKVEVDRLKQSGEWERRLNEAAKAHEPPVPHDPPSPSSSPVQIPPPHVGFVKVRAENVSMETVNMVTFSTLGGTLATDEPSQQSARVSDPVINRCIRYEGPVVPVYPSVQWQSPAYPETLCKHEACLKRSVPRTAAFRVAAKLSLPDDLHLAREARNYLAFPAHFFQHWSGYNVVPPLHDPTPVGALVPQFFGYYTPDGDSCGDAGDAGDAAHTPAPTPTQSDVYHSPILLIEHCGKPICIEKLSTDERHECAAMLFRFHEAGWLHESLGERNILVQKRRPTCSPLEEGEGEHRCEVPHLHQSRSFRLIDFGRSVKYSHLFRRSIEEVEGQYLFGMR